MGKTVYLQKFTSEKLDAQLKGFENHLKETDRAGSVRIYLGDVRRFAGWITDKYGSFNAQAVTPLDLVEYRNYLQGQKGRKGKSAAPATVNRALTSLRVFFAWLKDSGQVKDNPLEGIRMVPEGGPPAPRWLKRTEQMALMRAVRESGNTRDEAIIALMYHAGLRVSEVCALERGDIRISERAGQVTVRKGKGNKYREVPLNKTIRRILARWLEENPEGPLFPNRHGKPISTKGVFNLVAEYAYRAKLEDVTPHTLRHTFCKNAIDMGTPIDRVALMAGHSSLDVTKRYTTPSMADLQEEVEKWAWE